MALTITKKLIPTSRYNWKSHTTMKPVGICVHNTANDASALNEISYMTRVDAKVSYHYAVDDIHAVQALPENRTGWHAGDNLGPGNMKHIGIEICYSKSGGDRFIKSEQNAILLIVDILKRYGWGIDKVKKHQDFSGKYCLPIDVTELLTPNGWKLLTELEIGDIVAQYDNKNGEIEFVKIEDMVTPYEDEVIKIGKTEMTADHNVLAKSNNNHTHNYSMKKWGDIISKSTHYTIPDSGQINAGGLDISDLDLLLAVWIQADGHYMKRKGLLGEYYTGIEFHLSKERKVKRIVELLEKAAFRYTHIIQSDGTHKIRMFGKKYVEHFEKILKDKMFDWNLLRMNNHQFEIFSKELLLADGCLNANSYCTTKQKNYDVIQALYAINGKRSNQCKTGNSTALIFSSSNLDFNNERPRSTRTTTVSCVTVPSGAILIRQYGQPKIVGNCPHRTLDMGWQRFLNMVSKELAGDSWREDAKTLPEGKRIYESIKEVGLVKIDSGEIVKTYPKGTELEFAVQYGNWYITPYSFDRNIKNGFLVSEMKLKTEPIPEDPVVPSIEDTLRKQVADLEEENKVLKKDLAASISLTNDKNEEITILKADLGEWKDDYDDLQKKYDNIFIDKNKYENLYTEAVRELNDPNRVKGIKTAKLVAELFKRLWEILPKLLKRLWEILPKLLKKNKGA